MYPVRGVAMNFSSWVVAVLSASLLLVRPGKTASNFETAAHLFDYDARQALDIHDKIIEKFNGGTLHDTTYMSPQGGPVGAYLVVPEGKGRLRRCSLDTGQWHAGEFIPEAKITPGRRVSLIPDYPWTIRQPWHKSLDHFDKPEWTGT